MSTSSYRVKRWGSSQTDRRNYIVYLQANRRKKNGGGSYPANAILDETGDPLLDQFGDFIQDEGNP